MSNRMVIRDAKTLGAQIRRHRRSASLSQSALGEIACLRQATISSLENGDGGTLDTVFAVFTALKLELELQSRTAASDDLGDMF